jgi:hypothetical protein
MVAESMLFSLHEPARQVAADSLQAAPLEVHQFSSATNLPKPHLKDSFLFVYISKLQKLLICSLLTHNRTLASACMAPFYTVMMVLSSRQNGFACKS